MAHARALCDTFCWHFPWARGKREGIEEFFSLLDETLEIEQFEPRKFIGQGDTVVVLGYERDAVKQTGRGFENEWAHVYTLRDGKIATGLFLEDTAAYVEALSAG